jgi:hypothetical protein
MQTPRNALVTHSAEQDIPRLSVFQWFVERGRLCATNRCVSSADEGSRPIYLCKENESGHSFLRRIWYIPMNFHSHADPPFRVAINGMHVAANSSRLFFTFAVTFSHSHTREIRVRSKEPVTPHDHVENGEEHILLS